ncbi:MAG: hypothetical protein ACW963_10555, partial [Candidatus Sifarchaeia archaeon]
MDFGKEIRTILMKLREDQLIDEYSLIDGLNQLDKPVSTEDSSLSRILMVVVQVSSSHKILHELITRGEEIKQKIESKISSWEDNKLTNSDAREEISSLVKTKQNIDYKQESIKKRIDDTLTNLRTILTNLGINPTTFFHLSPSNTQTIDEERILSTFIEIWQKFLIEGGYETEKTLQRHKMPQIESDILNAFITPI